LATIPGIFAAFPGRARMGAHPRTGEALLPPRRRGRRRDGAQVPNRDFVARGSRVSFPLTPEAFAGTLTRYAHLESSRWGHGLWRALSGRAEESSQLTPGEVQVLSRSRGRSAVCCRNGPNTCAKAASVEGSRTAGPGRSSRAAGNRRRWKGDSTAGGNDAPGAGHVEGFSVSGPPGPSCRRCGRLTLKVCRYVIRLTSLPVSPSFLRMLSR